MKTIVKYPTWMAIIIVLLSCSVSNDDDKSSGYLSMADTLEQSLFENIVNKWYPRVIDNQHGGYLTNFSYNWEQQPEQDKYLVYIARHIWTLSLLYKNYPENSDYLEYAEHGFEFLKDKLWDTDSGGYYIAVDQEGIPLPEYLHEKRIYGHAFAIYALAEYYSVTKNEDVLEWAKKSFDWIENNPHDPINGGYFEFLNRDGSPVTDTGTFQTELRDRKVIGLKDYNSSIHILEALTTLYKVWPNDLVRERLEEMFYIVRDVMVTDPGHLLLYFKADWEQVTDDVLDEIAGEDLWFSDHVTFGHDIETSYLLFEAAEALEIHDDATHQIIKKLTDHTLMKGWDKNYGGIFDKGKYVGGDSLIIIDEKKAWWGEVEGLNSMLLLHSLYPDDEMDYYGYFLKQWKYINTYLIDHTNGGWYNASLDTNAKSKMSNKAHAWKTTYHNTRGMVNCINTLRKLAEVKDDKYLK